VAQASACDAVSHGEAIPASYKRRDPGQRAPFVTLTTEALATEGTGFRASDSLARREAGSGFLIGPLRAHLYIHIRGANGLSGIDDRPINAELLQPPLLVPDATALHELLPPPQPAIDIAIASNISAVRYFTFAARTDYPASTICR
jgi:hypothetical protein